MLRDYRIKSCVFFLTGDAYTPDAPFVAIPLVDSATPFEDRVDVDDCVHVDENFPSKLYVRPLPKTPADDASTYDTYDTYESIPLGHKATTVNYSTSDGTGAAQEGKSAEGNILLLLIRLVYLSFSRSFAV